MHRLIRFALILASAVIAGLLAACAPSATTDEAPGAAVTGRWGGDHVALELTSTGGTIEYDCAHGGLTQPVRRQSRGEFDVTGVHVREHGGPIREGERPDSVPARYVGRLSGDRMTLRVYVGPRPDTLGPFELRRGAEPRLFKCL
jgi:hypothetical protein